MMHARRKLASLNAVCTHVTLSGRHRDVFQLVLAIDFFRGTILEKLYAPLALVEPMLFLAGNLARVAARAVLIIDHQSIGRVI